MKTTNCKWCGKQFTTSKNAKQFCSKACREYAEKERKRQYYYRYMKKYSWSMNENRKFGLGSGRLGEHRNENMNKELMQIHKEMRRLGVMKE